MTDWRWPHEQRSAISGQQVGFNPKLRAERFPAGVLLC